MVPFVRTLPQSPVVDEIPAGAPSKPWSPQGNEHLASDDAQGHVGNSQSAVKTKMYISGEQPDEHGCS